MVGRRGRGTGEIDLSGADLSDEESDLFPAHTGAAPVAPRARTAEEMSDQGVELGAVEVSRRHRRQTLTFLAFFVLILLVGVFALLAFFGKVPMPVSSGRPAALPTCPSAAPPPPAPKDISVGVYNTTNRNGLAASVMKELQKRHFIVPSAPANDPRATVTGAALLRHGPAGAAAAKVVAENIVQGPVAYEVDARQGADVDLVLGQSFSIKPVTATAPSASPSASPTCTPAG